MNRHINTDDASELFVRVPASAMCSELKKGNDVREIVDGHLIVDDKHKVLIMIEDSLWYTNEDVKQKIRSLEDDGWEIYYIPDKNDSPDYWLKNCDYLSDYLVS